MNAPLLQENFRQRYGRAPQVIARAPGRIEFIGNHTDYNGGAVIGAAIDRYVWIAAAPANDSQRLRFASGVDGQTIEIPAAHSAKLTGAEAWINYPRGVWRSLADFNLPAPGAFDLLVASDLPTGAGLSSSAALELSTALALLQLAGAPAISPATLAAIGRHAENIHVGVPCGILDQGTSAFGRAGQLVHIDCRGPSFSLLPLPAEVSLWVFNSLEKHALVDGLYATRHQECKAAAAALGATWLTQISPADFDARADRLPPPQAARARHVIAENDRVAAVVRALEAGDLRSVGELLKASHRSSRELFENSTPSLDSLVELLSAAPGVYGARLTGGGFGGAVMALTDRSFDAEAAAQIAARHAARQHPQPEVIQLHTGDGAKLIPLT
ncbi:MAG: galactokinase [Candidatus Didemnitutus sp.]|nr:galactokinase [Candidatus Didemnitutus sp.]